MSQIIAKSRSNTYGQGEAEELSGFLAGFYKLLPHKGEFVVEVGLVDKRFVVEKMELCQVGGWVDGLVDWWIG